MQREVVIESARRGALKEMVRYAHLMAASWMQGCPDTNDMTISVELRRLADRLDDLATNGTAPALAQFFGVAG